MYSYGRQPADSDAPDDNAFQYAPFLSSDFPAQSAADSRFLYFLQNRYDPTMMPGPGADGDSSMSFFNDIFQSNGYHPIYNLSAHQDSGPPYPLPQYFPVFPLPIMSIDGTTTLAPGSEDLRPLGELPCFNEPLPLGDSFHVREPPPPPPPLPPQAGPSGSEPLPLGDPFHIREPPPPPLPPQAGPSGSRTRQPPEKEKAYEFKVWPYPRARPKLRGITSAQTAAHEALLSSANAKDEEYGSQWSAENLTAFYKSFTVPPSAVIMSTTKKHARNVVPFGYSLQPSIWLEDYAPEYQIETVKDLIGNPSFC
ncbi:uncharacterized protein HD556DRAFT_1450357 [Suillus plorans]|uniref:Uncharacterized protein n=1 Tax=Suillus plorans TaxID=116603 RepID=A0A9P7DAR5_9AGAM|nr:uncharacterized protein HD556DRAFT_1450357 [Suillus plorans]KAG1785804.1 hypothetical protein HD556DRAFT_1450357 [Suillus plorans]